MTSYEEIILEETPSLQNISKEQKAEYLKGLREFKQSLTGYEKTVFDKLDELADATKKVNKAKVNNEKESTIQTLKQIESLKLFELEEFGVTTSDRYNANPNYWNAKAIESKISIENDKLQSTNYIDSESNIYQIHTGYTSLKRTSVLTFPCWNHYGIQTSCFIINSGWNTGSSISEIWFISTNGSVRFGHSVCNEGNYHHNSINFDYGVERDIHSILQTKLYSYDKTFDITLNGDNGSCSDKIKYKSVSGGSRAGMVTIISDMSEG